MSAPKPGPLSLVPFVSVDDMMGIANETGVQRFLSELAEYIEVDFRRWESFDKTPRLAAHSREGVIELMPTSDGVVYGFKIRQRASAQPSRRPTNRDGVRSAVECQ